ncbi:MAG: Uma2 family endonuclease [Mycobacteriales bacterium]
MSATPMHQNGPWTFDELEELPDDQWRYEVVDGALLMTPPPTDFHQAVSRRLFLQLVRQAPREWEPVYEVAFRVRTDGRVPDLAVVRAGLDVRPRQVAYAPSDFGLLIEIVSPTSTGMDRVLKPAEYAAAGVPFYWRVETEPIVEVVGYELVDGAYREGARVSAVAGPLPAPFGLVIDAAALSTS